MSKRLEQIECHRFFFKCNFYLFVYRVIYLYDNIPTDNSPWQNTQCFAMINCIRWKVFVLQHAVHHYQNLKRHF